ncbi:MAG: GNAT family N-acetyltransferase [Rhizobiaceae bacterium]|nr:GNAT family N-acetyltransferase [Rhizobiaceae bacterium]
MTIRFVSLTPDLWPAFELLFGRQGACYGCWCTYFRLPPKKRRESSGDRNRDLIRARIEAGPPPGVLAFEGDDAVGWMQIGPRADVPEWNNQRRVSAPLEMADARAPDMWAITCFFVRKSDRGRGITHGLVGAGIGMARAAGARVVDACPTDHSNDASGMGLFVGSTRVFERAGFVPVAVRRAGRPLMRLKL